MNFEWAHQDDLFIALDRQTVSQDGRSWQLRIYSIRALDDALWIDLTLVGMPTFVLTLRQPVDATPTEILGLLSRLVTTEETADGVIFQQPFERPFAGDGFSTQGLSTPDSW